MHEHISLDCYCITNAMQTASQVFELLQLDATHLSQQNANQHNLIHLFQILNGSLVPIFFNGLQCAILVPPSIVDTRSSTDLVVREKEKVFVKMMKKVANQFEVNLTCEARGYPQPQIMWRREDGRSITANGHTKKGLHSLHLPYLEKEPTGDL